eukprot:scaffold151807_cov13-Prasinocladus_malaysianus.AAC.1
MPKKSPADYASYSYLTRYFAVLRGRQLALGDGLLPGRGRGLNIDLNTDFIVLVVPCQGVGVWVVLGS